jgi:GT2 family glycosyltransferase
MNPLANASLSAWGEIDSHHQPIGLGQDVSIGIAAYGNAEATRRCLEALFRSAEGDFELILINDCSPDNGQTLSVFNWASDIHQNTFIYDIVGRNIEYSGSVNLLLSHAKGEMVMFISNDICITPYYLKAVCQVGSAASGWGVLRGSSNFVDNELSSHNIQPGGSISRLEDIFRESQSLYSIYADLCVPDRFLTGDAFVVSRELIDRIGTFDPLFLGYFADHDYGVRANSVGLATFLLPGAYAFHDAGGNISYLSEEDQARKLNIRWSRLYENWDRFKLKYQIPAEQQYTSINDISWEEIASLSRDPGAHYVPPQDYQSYLIRP